MLSQMEHTLTQNFCKDQESWHKNKSLWYSNKMQFDCVIDFTSHNTRSRFSKYYLLARQSKRLLTKASIPGRASSFNIESFSIDEHQSETMQTISFPSSSNTIVVLKDKFYPQAEILIQNFEFQYYWLSSSLSKPPMAASHWPKAIAFKLNSSLISWNTHQTLEITAVRLDQLVSISIFHFNLYKFNCVWLIIEATSDSPLVGWLSSEKTKFQGLNAIKAAGIAIYSRSLIASIHKFNFRCD